MARLFTPSESKYYLMALDAGTGSIRAVIFDLEGNQIAVGQAEWRHLAVPDVPGSMEFDLNKNWQLACECMHQALHNAGIAPELKSGITPHLPLLTCPLTRINVTKRHCFVRWKKMRRLYQRVTCSKLLISRIFIPPRWFLLAEVQKGNYGVKFSLMSRDYPSIFR